jgi:hypothetical protein
MKSLSGAAAILAIVGATDPAFAMTDYKWKYRPLVVFADSESIAPLAEQRRMVAASRASLAERNVVVIWVIGDKVSAEFGPHPRESAKALRARFGASKSAFRAVLVGKDGGTKLNSASPLGAGALYATIDAMPMRQNEIRRP